MIATAASVETLVLVLRLLNIMATVLPRSSLLNACGELPDLTAFLWEAAFRTNCVNSSLLRSPMVMR